MSPPNSSDEGAGSAPEATTAAEPPVSYPPLVRVGQACTACRRKKIRCDGKQPCNSCTSRKQSCEFPGSRDNASTNRHYVMSFEMRFQQMDGLCQRLEGLIDQLSQYVGQPMHGARLILPGAQEDLIQAANVLRSMPNSLPAFGVADQDAIHNANAELSHDSLQYGRAHVFGELYDSDDVSSEFEEEDTGPRIIPAEGQHSHAGALVKDSYGRLRFVGGATNSILIDAVKNLSPMTGSVDSPDAPQGSIASAPSDLEIPLFVRGQVWPETPFLPKPHQLDLPPQYIADLLMRVYFDQLHYTFPIVYKPYFMSRYKQTIKNAKTNSEPKSRRFLMVFFAVCACASSVLPTVSGGAFSGMKFYEKALLLYYASVGEASLERVQCLGLLAMCAAGWNTLTQSWLLAGQAIRAAMDIGLHLSDSLMVMPPRDGRGSHFLRREISRRVWWSIYSLDRATSMCLGRPLAANDDDCYCEFPTNMRDEDLEQLSRQRGRSHLNLDSQKLLPTTGFLAFARLCRIAGSIQQLNSPRHLRDLASCSLEKKRRLMSRVRSHDQALRSWLESLPDDLRFSANLLERGQEGDRDLTMCVVIFIVHAGSLLNLYRCFLGQTDQSNPLSAEASSVNAVSQCVSAARSCINAAELLRDFVPPSHHLAMCLHYLTLSGIVLLRIATPQIDTEIIADVEKAVGFLQDLELRWSGASRSKAIIEQLLTEHRKKSSFDTQTVGNPNSMAAHRHKRSFAEFEVGDEVGNEAPAAWLEIPGWELFADQELLGTWDAA